MTIGFSRLAPWTLIITLTLVMNGCGNADSAAVGVVEFSDGSPVQSGSVEFRSLGDGSQYASRIAADGGFTLTDQDGDVRCPPGEYEVVVVQIVLTEDLAAEDHDHGRTVPRRYADYYTSDLRTKKAENEVEPIRITLETE